MSVCYNKQYHNVEKMDITPTPYLLVVYNMKKFLQAVSEEWQQMDRLMHVTNSKVLPPAKGDNFPCKVELGMF